tara:strand:- start:4645 stop:6606 length:1962 start_codon:yes stop_codon:yes gene_type:complete
MLAVFVLHPDFYSRFLRSYKPTTHHCVIVLILSNSIAANQISITTIFSTMGSNFRYFLAASALLWPLGAEVIATPLRAEVLPVKDSTVSPIFPGGFRIPVELAHGSLATVFANIVQQEAIAARLHPAASQHLGNLDANQTDMLHAKRAPINPVPADPAPVGWEYYGCFIDTGSIEDSINYGFYWQPENPGPLPAPPIMSADVCTASCSMNGRSAFAGLDGSTCYCFDKRPSRSGRQLFCEKPCFNNAEEACGGDSAGATKLTVYRRGREYDIEPRPATPPPSGWQYSGCFSLEAYAYVALLNGFSTGNATNGNYESSVEQCIAICNNNGYWLYAGLTSNGCFCSNTPPFQDLQLEEEHCQAQCPDHANQACGGLGYTNWYVSVYKLQTEIMLAPPNPVPSTEDGEWFYKGCYRTAEYLRTSTAYIDLGGDARAGTCIEYCDNADNYDLAALIGTGCHCNLQENFHRHDLLVSTEYCSFKCLGQEEEPCGGSRIPPEEELPENDNTMTLYGRFFENIENPNLVPFIIPGAVLWELAGCYSNSDIIDSVPFKYRNESASEPNMSPELCIAICKENNNWLYAMPYDDGTCLCSGQLPETGLLSDGEDEECDLPCPGHPNEYCGGLGEDEVPRIRFWQNPLESARTEYMVRPPVPFV